MEVNEMIKRYKIIVMSNVRGNFSEYTAYYLNFPIIRASGETINDCVDKIERQLIKYFKSLIERGEKIPAPGVRNQQVNIRFTAEEKTFVQEKAHQKGMRLSEYIRSTVT